MLHRASVRVVSTDDLTLRDLALRIGYKADTQMGPERTMLDEIRYHTDQVQKIFQRHTVSRS